MMEKIDPNKWTIVCAEQGIGDQILFMHSMNEAIDELGNSVYYRKKIISNYKEKFSQDGRGTKGLHTTGQEII